MALYACQAARSTGVTMIRRAGEKKLVVALGAELSRKRLRTGERYPRRVVEESGGPLHRLAYFERVAQGMAKLLYEKGVC